MNILFDNSTEYNITENIKNLIEKSILTTLNFENFTTNVEISFSIVSNIEIQQINNQHRNIDRPTDVLSFPLLDNISNIKFNNIYPILLGDIIISIEKTISQANEYGHSIERELCFLTVHSMLHLLGYDHMEEDEEKIMFEKQDNILNAIGITR